MKASQCFTKYKWRDLDAAKRQSGPQIVATQVIIQIRVLHGDIIETEPLKAILHGVDKQCAHSDNLPCTAAKGAC